MSTCVGVTIRAEEGFYYPECWAFHCCDEPCNSDYALIVSINKIKQMKQNDWRRLDRLKNSATILVSRPHSCPANHKQGSAVGDDVLPSYSFHIRWLDAGDKNKIRKRIHQGEKSDKNKLNWIRSWDKHSWDKKGGCEQPCSRPQGGSRGFYATFKVIVPLWNVKIVKEIRSNPRQETFLLCFAHVVCWCDLVWWRLIKPNLTSPNMASHAREGSQVVSCLADEVFMYATMGRRTPRNVRPFNGRQRDHRPVMLVCVCVCARCL